MIITKEELFACLSDTKALLDLFIQDVRDGNAEDHIFIYDSLLERLAWRADPSWLVPNLHNCSFGSLFCFDDRAFVKFLESRLVSGGAHDEPFGIEAFSIALSNDDVVERCLGVLAIMRMAALKNGANFAGRGIIPWPPAEVSGCPMCVFIWFTLPTTYFASVLK
ncbi:hypothetical protein K438DRAFT_1986633 [Mycena galopus ATCC 62051]|nr:hypothetical protein K438DRAFT_1986633 [Mycena galopus ATCC 62051]